MGVLLGLGGVQLLQAVLGNDVGQDLLREGLGEGNLDVERRVVLGNRDEVRQGNLLALEAVKALVGEDAGHLAGTVGAEVEEDHRVAGSHALVVGGKRLDELVAARVLLVVGLNALDRAGVHGGRRDDDVVGALDALPAVVAVHGPVAARHGGDAGVDAGLGRQVLEEVAELGHVAGTGLRVDVAAVHEGVDANALDAALGGHLGERLDVAHVRVHAARAHEAHEVQGLARGLDVVHGLDEDLVLGDGAVLDGVVDAAELLEHDAAGTDVEVAHLGVAHLAVGQAHVLAGGAQRGVRELGVERVEVGVARAGDGVLIVRRGQAAAVHDDEQGREMTLSHN